MTPALILALIRVGTTLGADLIDLLRKEGVEITNEDLKEARDATQSEVDRFNDLIKDD